MTDTKLTDERPDNESLEILITLRKEIAERHAKEGHMAQCAVHTAILNTLLELQEYRKAEPVAWLWVNERLEKHSVSFTDPADEENTQDAIACGWKHQPLYITPHQPTYAELADLQKQREFKDILECETCSGTGKIDERLGGYSFSNPESKCPDCDGNGEYYLEPQPIAEIVSKYGDPEAFGERELRPIADIQKMPYNSKLYSMPLKSPKIPAGFTLVPTAPTQEMVLAGGDTYVRCEDVNQYPSDAARRIWSAMLQGAAPCTK